MLRYAVGVVPTVFVLRETNYYKLHTLKQNTMRRSTKKLKKDFIEVYKAKLCNIALSCRSLGIERKTFYNWINSDPDFKQAIEDAQEERKDFFENALILRCQAGDTAAIIFANKTQCRDRGYVEKIEKDVTVKTEQPLFGDYDESKEC